MKRQNFNESDQFLFSITVLVLYSTCIACLPVQRSLTADLRQIKHTCASVSVRSYIALGHKNNILYIHIETYKNNVFQNTDK